MDKLLYLVGPLGCAVMMAVCMAMMARGMRCGAHADQPDNTEVAALRAEVAQLRAEQTQPAAPIDG